MPEGHDRLKGKRIRRVLQGTVPNRAQLTALQGVNTVTG